MEDAVWKFVQILIEQLIMALLPILIAAIIGWVTYAIKRTRDDVGEQQWAAIENAVRLAIYAAEQAGLSNAIANEGAVKKRIAIEYAQGFLATRGIAIDVERLADLIEATVAEQFNWKLMQHS